MTRLAAILLSLICYLPLQAQEDGSGWDFSGHGKYQLNGYSYPDDSIFRDALGSSAIDQGMEARLKFSKRTGGWDFQADYQLIGIYADTLQLAGELPGSEWLTRGVINDDRRWFDLTWTIADSSQGALVHRFDRASVGYSTDKTVWRFGRQAVSWGNGMLFNPMDIFNPFDPAAVDKEYKTGDDMLYGQYLLDNGNDFQGVAVVRRNPLTGDVESDQSSLAFKYHGFIGMNEYDLLVSKHYDDLVIGAGGSMDIGGAVLRGDLSWTDTDRDDVLSAVASLSYSWLWGGKNVSGVLEYYYNGFGQPGGEYATEDLLHNPDLLLRIERGELFTLSRNYLAASATIEMTPLFMLIPSAFVNLEDPSSLVQLVAQYDWKQDLQLLAAVNLPAGPSGSEYGGIESPVEGMYFSTGPSLFAQLAWYF
mgnify:CR=1 FL=1